MLLTHFSENKIIQYDYIYIKKKNVGWGGEVPFHSNTLFGFLMALWTAVCTFFFMEPG